MVPKQSEYPIHSVGARAYIFSRESPKIQIKAGDFNVDVYMYVPVCVHVCMCTYACIYVCLCVCVHLFVCIYVCMNVWVYVCTSLTRQT